ncbi:hypothetical protein [Neolewinella litorea]|uniref:Outer membrane protein beta-barrel domain-containing protein n=1 Tax=Neolewinella litorea TaxID=2562452 RepID=A0A4S4NP88_9BACT|nr:hypothetical protein [Neolewinella litorea]THH41849.1 hypothetical protein E4021_04480 [Neolewinella litorea]
MNHLLLFVSAFLLLHQLPAQQGAVASRSAPDRIVLTDGQRLKGKLTAYRYGDAVSLVTADGQTYTFSSDRIKRVEMGGRSGRFASTALSPHTGAADLPRREWRHQVRTSAGFTDNIGEDFYSVSTLGIGIDYHYLRQWKALAAGLGGAMELMDADRSERLASLTGLVEYQLGGGRLRPLFRFSGGVALPVGGRGLKIESRTPGAVVHPAIGLLLLPPSGSWGAVVMDVGYRFSHVSFRGTDGYRPAFYREVTYRRLTLGIATRF